MKENNVSEVLNFLGWTIIVLGTIIGFSYFRDEYGGAFCIVFIVTEIVTGIFILGFAENLKLLNEINIRLDYIGNKNYDKIYEKMDNDQQVTIETDSLDLTTDEIIKIKSYFQKKMINVEDVISIPFAYYCIVKIEETYELVDLRGFEPIIIDSEKIGAMPEIKNWLIEQGYMH